MYNGSVEIGNANGERSSPDNFALPAQRSMADGECIANVVFAKAGEYLRGGVIVNRFIGEGFYITDQRLVDEFALVIFNADNIECILRKPLFYQPVEFTVMLELAVHTFKLLGIGSIWDGDGNFQRNGFGVVVMIGVELPDHLLVVGILQPKEQSIIP